MTRQVALNAEEPVNVAARPIVPAAGAAQPARATLSTAYTRPFGNDQLNSRAQAPLSEGKWKVFWQTDLHPRMTPRFVLQDANRIVVEAGVWQVFNNRDGKLVAKGGSGPGSVVMDFPNGLFYFVDTNGLLVGYGLADGKRQWGISPSFGESFARPYFARLGNTMVILGVEQPMDAHGHHKPDKSVLEARELSQPPRVSPSGLLASAVEKGKLHIQSTQVVAAAGEKEVVFAVPGRVEIADLDMNVTAALEGTFEPLSMSLDEAGRIYLLVRSEGQGALWALSPEGQRVFSASIADMPDFPTPPVVGYDHRVYVRTKQRVVAFGADGKVAWELPSPGKLAGLTVTTDDQIVMAAGSQVLSVDPKGDQKLLMDLAGEKLSTPPVVRSDGAILVASESKLFCLIAQ